MGSSNVTMRLEVGVKQNNINTTVFVKAVVA